MKKKNIIMIVITVIIFLNLSFYVVTGFNKRTDVVLIDYAVSEDGTEITLNAQVPTSMGYIRAFKDNGGGVKPHYLTFYSNFGINDPLGAKSEFVLELAENDSEIYFNRPGGGYELVLRKNEKSGEWERP